MILADTSVWVSHFRGNDSHLPSLLENDLVAMHPMVIGELACGNIQNRDEVFNHLQSLPQVKMATDSQAYFFIRYHELMGRGVGYIDVHLLAAAMMTPPTQLWTADKRLDAVADELGLAFSQDDWEE